MLRTLGRIIKRNPVINGFIVAMLAQFAHDYMANEIDWTNIAGYFATLFIAVAVRERTVPLGDHEKKVAKLMDTNSKLVSKWTDAGKELPHD